MVVVQALMLVWVADSELSVGVHLLCYSLIMLTVLYLALTRVFGRWLPFEQKELLLAYVVLAVTTWRGAGGGRGSRRAFT